MLGMPDLAILRLMQGFLNQNGRFHHGTAITALALQDPPPDLFLNPTRPLGLV